MLLIHVCPAQSTLRIVKDRHSEVIPVTSVDTVLPRRGSALFGKNDKVCLEVFCFVLLIDFFRPTGELNTAVSPPRIDKKPRCSMTTKAMNLIRVAVAVFENDITNRLTFFDTKGWRRWAGVIHRSIHGHTSSVHRHLVLWSSNGVSTATSESNYGGHQPNEQI